MTKKLEYLYNSPDRSKTMKSIREAFCDFIGPLTTREIWDTFSDPKFGRTKDLLPIRGSALAIFNSVNELFIAQPTSGVTDEILRLIQQNTESEIYPGARTDLGIQE